MKRKLLIIMLFWSTILFAQHETYWTSQATGFTTPQRAITQIDIVNENDVWALAKDGTEENANIQEFTRTIDGGETWIPGTINVGDSESGIAMISAVSATTAWVAVYPHTTTELQGIYKTTDGGTTWIRQNTALFNQPGSFCNVVHFWDENIGFAQGDPVDGYYELYTTEDGGENWSRVPTENIPSPEGGEYGYTAKIFAIDNTLWWSTNHARLFRSTDYGHSFEVFQMSVGFESSYVRSYSFKDNNNGYLINEEGLFWKTSDGGEIWNLQFPSGEGSTKVFGNYIASIPNTSVVITSGDSSLTGSGFSYSIDSGQSFITPCEDHGHLAMQFINRHTGWSGSWNIDATTGGIYKYSGPELIDIESFSQNSICLSPNPADDIISISNEQIIDSIKIYNMLGQEMLSILPNTKETSIDINGLQSGSYTIIVESNSSQSSLILIK